MSTLSAKLALTLKSASSPQRPFAAQWRWAAEAQLEVLRGHSGNALWGRQSVFCAISFPPAGAALHWSCRAWIHMAATRQAREDGWWESVWPGTIAEHVALGNCQMQRNPGR